MVEMFKGRIIIWRHQSLQTGLYKYKHFRVLYDIILNLYNIN